MENLYAVNYNIFHDYIVKNKLKEVQGSVFHSDNFIDENNVIKAYRESSSWGAETVYLIADENYKNLETLSTITNFINKF